MTHSLRQQLVEKELVPREINQKLRTAKARKKLNRLISLVSEMRWYIKTSNDRNFRYKQFTTFLGAEFSLFSR